MSSNGIAINNPCNIRYDGTTWEGLANPPEHNGFCVFADPIHGLRAAMVNLKNYQIFHDIDTIALAIERHAPPSENPTQKYIDYVSKQTGIGPYIRIDFTKRDYAIPVIRSMAEFESGPQNVHYTQDIYDHAADLAYLS